MTTIRTAAQQALEALESGLLIPHSAEVFANLRAALAEPERTPLNEDQMNEAYIYIWRNLPDGFDHTASAWIETAIRYAERAHGIIGPLINDDK